VIDPSLYQRLKGMTRAERKVEFEKITGQPALPKWEFENLAGEKELIEMTERQEREKDNLK